MKPVTKRLVTAGAIVIAAVLLVVSLRGTDWAFVYRSLANADLRYVLIGCALFTLNLLLKSLRWRVLLSAKENVPVAKVFWATNVGYFGNNLLPARAGELARVMMITSQTGLSTAWVLTTALLERVSDAFVLLLIAGVCSRVIPNAPSWLLQSGGPVLVLAVTGIIVLVFSELLKNLALSLMAALKIPAKIERKAADILSQIADGIRSLHNLQRAAKFLALTGSIWVLDSVGTVIGGRALQLDIPLGVAFLLIAALGLGSALPSTPGYVGIYQFVAVTILTPFGISRSGAIAYIVFAQALSYVLIGFWGGLGLMWRSRTIRQESRDDELRSVEVPR